MRMALMEQWMGLGETTSADGDGPPQAAYVYGLYTLSFGQD